jgi:elongation factor 2
MMGSKSEKVEGVPCGNTVALVGIDSWLNKSGTITSNPQSHPLKNMKYSVSPVVRVAIAPKNLADLPKLVDSLKKLSKSDPLVLCLLERTGEHIIACAGELHLEICLNDLREFMEEKELIVSEPVVPFKETVTDRSSMVCLSKSANRHNRLYMVSEPLESKLVEAIETGEINPQMVSYFFINFF